MGIAGLKKPSKGRPRIETGICGPDAEFEQVIVEAGGPI